MLASQFPASPSSLPGQVVSAVRTTCGSVLNGRPRPESRALEIELELLFPMAGVHPSGTFTRAKVKASPATGSLNFLEGAEGKTSEICVEKWIACDRNA